MNKKTVISAFLAFALVFSFTVFRAYAYDGGKREWSHQGLGKKFFYKARLILKNRDELGLTGKQLKKIKSLKIKTKKYVIRKDAELSIIALDVKAAIMEKQIDTAAVNKLLDKKYDFKRDKAKSLLAAYAALKRILTDEQKGKLKNILKMHKEEMKWGSMVHGSMMQSSMMKGKKKCYKGESDKK